MAIEKVTLLKHGLLAARDRLTEACLAARLTENHQLEDLTVISSLAEVLWWDVAYDEALGGYRGLPTLEAELQAGFRFARNSISHGIQVWEPTQNGLPYPLKYPMTFGWKWKSLPEPDGGGHRHDQWIAYETGLVGHDIVRALDDYQTYVLGLGKPVIDN